jgi:signal transduction histidine kinase
LFNLFKNALHAIAIAGKGEIFISIEPANPSSGKKHNQLIFKDTGPGISPDNLRHIFDRFYTKTEHGTGIGLAFCQSVMQRLGGQITCTSRQGEHTTFTLSFPVLKESSSAQSLT